MRSRHPQYSFRHAMGLLPYLNTAESCRRWDDSIPEWLKPGVPVSVRFILETEDQGVAEQWEAGVVHSVDSEARVVSAAFATDKSSLYNVPFSDVREGLLRPSLVFQGVQDACSDPFVCGRGVMFTVASNMDKFSWLLLCSVRKKQAGLSVVDSGQPQQIFHEMCCPIHAQIHQFFLVAQTIHVAVLMCWRRFSQTRGLRRAVTSSRLGAYKACGGRQGHMSSGWFGWPFSRGLERHILRHRKAGHSSLEL